jgi:hypothetical protein
MILCRCLLGEIDPSDRLLESVTHPAYYPGLFERSKRHCAVHRYHQVYYYFISRHSYFHDFNKCTYTCCQCVVLRMKKQVVTCAKSSADKMHDRWNKLISISTMRRMHPPELNWVPPPPLSKQRHSFLGTGSKGGDILSMLVSIYGSKELFVNEASIDSCWKTSCLLANMDYKQYRQGTAYTYTRIVETAIWRNEYATVWSHD